MMGTAASITVAENGYCTFGFSRICISISYLIKPRRSTVDHKLNFEPARLSRIECLIRIEYVHHRLTVRQDG
jgi:hypothetical protein